MPTKYAVKILKSTREVVQLWTGPTRKGLPPVPAEFEIFELTENDFKPIKNASNHPDSGGPAWQKSVDGTTIEPRPDLRPIVTFGKTKVVGDVGDANTTATVELSPSGPATIEICDSRGRLIDVALDGSGNGSLTVRFDAPYKTAFRGCKDYRTAAPLEVVCRATAIES